MTKKRIFRLMCAAAIVIAMTACNKDNDKGKSVSVYVVGSINYWDESGVTGVSGMPMVWVNGVQNPGLIPNAGGVNDIFVSGYNVYIVGYTIGLGATLWTNGIPTILPTDGIPTFDGREPNAYPFAVFVENGDVYVAGQDNDFYGRAFVYWKNGVLQKVVESPGIFVRGMSVYNGVTYVVGYKRTAEGNRAVLWIDGEERSMHHDNPQQHSELSGIFIENGEIYISGNLRSNYYYYPLIWCGNTTDLQFQSVGMQRDNSMEALGICAQNGIWYQLLQDTSSPYYGGYRSGTTIHYNGMTLAEPTDFDVLTEGDAVKVEAICVDKGNVYVVATNHKGRDPVTQSMEVSLHIWGLPDGRLDFSLGSMGVIVASLSIYGIAVGQ